MTARFEEAGPRRRVLLVNPPARPATLRDYYCSTWPKAGYLWHPMDLLALTGPLGTHDLAVLDAVAEGLDEAAALARARASAPDAAVLLVGALTTAGDLAFGRDLRAATGLTTLLASGEPFLDRAAALLAAHPHLDGALFDFLGPDALALLAGRTDAVSNAAFPGEDGVEVRKQPVRGNFRLGRVRHDLFAHPVYRVPPGAPAPFASVLASFGCPYRCAYCNSGAGSLGYARRDLDDLAAELRELHATGTRNLFFRDMSFAAEPSPARELLDLLRGFTPRFAFTCYARPDQFDLDLLPALADAGCRLLQLGVESARPGILAAQKRPAASARVTAAFHAAREHGIEAGAHFVLGLPGDDAASIRETIAWAVALDPVYASFNVFAPRHGSTARERLLADPGAACALTAHQLRRLQREANARFYLRPRYVMQRLRGARGAGEIKDLARAAAGLLRGNPR